MNNAALSLFLLQAFLVAFIFGVAALRFIIQGKRCTTRRFGREVKMWRST